MILSPRHLTRSLATLALLAMLALTTACAGASAQRPAPTSAPQKAYYEAEDAFDSDNFLEAVKQYNLVRSRYPYSEYAALSELRIADAYYAQDRFATAIEQYRAFIKLHANHPRVVYANWRVAESFYRQMPQDWFFMPPAYERDLARARDAERELSYYLRNFKASEYAPRAAKLLVIARRRLADHELYVARFYLERDNPRAAALRLTNLLRTYPGLGLDPPALFLLARAYLELGDVDRAVVALGDLIRVHPSSPLAERARRYMRAHNLRLKRQP